MTDAEAYFNRMEAVCERHGGDVGKYAYLVATARLAEIDDSKRFGGRVYECASCGKVRRFPHYPVVKDGSPFDAGERLCAQQLWTEGWRDHDGQQHCGEHFTLDGMVFLVPRRG